MQAALGIMVLLGIGWLLSEDRRGVPWRVVAVALALQVGVALLIVHVPLVQSALIALNSVVEALDAAAGAGASFVFGYLGGAAPPFDVTNPSTLFIFSFRLAAQILLFSVVMAIGWHWGIVPAVVRTIGGALRRTLGVGGAVGLGAAASIFVGPVETALTVRPALATMSRSELFMLLTAPMATVAGTVMVLYASILEAVLPASLGHILAASVISAPAGILFGVLMVPTRPGAGAEAAEVALPEADYDGLMDAIARGTADGIQLVANVLAMLVVFVALVALVNGVLGVVPDIAGAPLTLERALGWVLAPVAWLLGVPWDEASLGGSLLGTQLVLNELLAYLQMAGLPDGQLSPHSIVVLTYAMCGFANFGTLGIMVGGLLAMMPERRREVLALAPRTLISGTLATFTTGAVVGLVTSAGG
jgi:CNT family concentrative nucleoside transporter